MTRARAGTRTGAAAALVLLLTGTLLAGCGQGADGVGAGPTTTQPTDTGSDGMTDGTDATGGPPTDGATAPDLLVPDPTGGSDGTGGSGLPVDPSGAELTLVVGGPGGAQPPVTLSCDWTTGTATGTHPDPGRACADLRAALAAGDPFAPVPPDAMCTQVFGGDATAQVTGAVLAADGGPVDVAATFALDDGCEIERWQRLGAVLGPYGGAT